MASAASTARSSSSKAPSNVGYDEVVEIVDSQGELRRGRVLEVGENTTVVQVFAGSTGLSIDGTRVRFLGSTLHIPVAEEMLGRVFDGLGIASRWRSRTADGPLCRCKRPAHQSDRPRVSLATISRPGSPPSMA